MKPNKCLLLLAVALAPGLMHADAGSLHTLSDYLEYALENNSGLMAMEASVDAAKNRIPQARSLPDPMFQVTHFIESVQTRTGPQENIFMLSQKFPWFGVLNGKEDAAAGDAEAMALRYWNKQLMLVQNVSRKFYEYGFTGKAIELTEENISLLEKLEPIVETRVQSGGNLNQLLRLKVEIGKLGDDLASLKQKRNILSAELNALLNLSAYELREWPEWEAPDAIDVDEEQLASRLIEQNPELQALDQTIAAEKARGKVARRSSYPDFMLGVNYIQIGDPEVMTDTPDAGEDPWAVTAAVSIPLWGGKNDGQRKEALARERSATAEKINRMSELHAQLRTSAAKYTDANRRLNLYGDELLGLAKQAVENSRTGYESGGVTILELIDSERSLLALQLMYWRAAADAWMERITIQTLTDSNLENYFQY